MANFTKLKVTPWQLESAAGEMANRAAAIAAVLDKINAVIETDLNNAWVGSDYDTYKQGWLHDRELCENYLKQIKNITTLLRNAAAEYTKAENNSLSAAYQVR